MGFFDKLINKNKTTENNIETPSVEAVMIKAPTGRDVTLELNKNSGPLNLGKNDFLNLSKSAISLTNLRAGAGWDFKSGRSFDLDLVAYLMSNGRVKETVYYGDKNHGGIYLDGDNLTGEGDGDDENIFINFSKIDSDIDKIIIAVVIYMPMGQRFSKVENAFIRLVDETNKKEVLKFNLSEDGGDNTAVQAAELIKTNEGWIFKATEIYSKDSIDSLKKKL